ncbi:MAG: hypothetical protein AAGA81_05885 [Acidobacteriota bacterium]
MSGTDLSIGLSAVIVSVTDEVPHVLTVDRAEAGEEHRHALPFGPLDPAGDRTLELGLRGWVRQQTGLELGYVEQLYTFGDRDRIVSASVGGRVISVAYLALMRESDAELGRQAEWNDVYSFLRWEDWRRGRPSVIDERIAPALGQWVMNGPPEEQRDRRERVEITFGLGRSQWDGERVLERYELLYEAGLVPEAGASHSDALGTRAMALDHRRILATALARLRGKLKYRPLVFEVMPPEFTLLQLQKVVEALSGVRLHKQNFRRLVDRGGLVEGTGRVDARTGGRPAELFRFRREVVRERPSPGVGLPSLRSV